MTPKQKLKKEEDYCVKCGSEDLKDVIRNHTFNLKSIGVVTISQKCEECQDCGEIYFSQKQMGELSEKIKKLIFK